MADEEHYLDRILPLRRVQVDDSFRRDVRYLNVRGSGAGVTVSGQTMTLELDFASADGPGIISIDDAVKLAAIDAWETTDLELPLVVTGAQFTTITSDDLEADGYLALPLAASGHGANGIRAIYIPAGLANGIRVADDENTEGWATYNPAQDCIAWIGCVTASPRRFWSALQLLGTRDTTAPTIESATIDGSDPDKLVVVYSEDCWHSDAAIDNEDGVRVSGGSPACTITAIVSGNGTDTITYDLSRDAVEDDEGDLSFTSGTNKIQDMNGNYLANAPEVIAFSGFAYTMPGEVFKYWGASTTYNGSLEVTTVANGTAGATNWGALAPTGTISRVTTGTGRHGWRMGIGEYLTADAVAQLAVPSGSLFMVVQTTHNAASYEFLASLGKHGALTTAEIALIQYGTTNTMLGRTDSGGAQDASVTGPGTALHGILLVWDTSERRVYIDGVDVGSNGTDQTPDDIRRIAVCHDCNTLNGSKGQVDMYDLRLSPTKLSVPQVAALFAWSSPYYGHP